MNKLPIPNEKKGNAIMYIHGFPGINKKYNITYPTNEMDCDSIKAFFFPNFFDIQATEGITIKVVPKAPKHPNIETHMPLASASPLNNL